MNKKRFIFFFLLPLLLKIFRISSSDAFLSLDPEIALKMGKQIWHNECGGRVEGLTSWNQGEEFASLGIGHFIWYPSETEIVFKQTFPSLIVFFKERNISFPTWLEEVSGCPWKSRSEFLENLQSARMVELRHLLATHVDLQVMFMVLRLQKALPLMVNGMDEARKNRASFQFNRLAQTYEGVFVLLDYINFKGEGVAVTERYAAEGWGLLQVLQSMRGKRNGPEAIDEFVEVAKEKLSRRVLNSPSERNEKRWLAGWFNRLDSYKKLTF